MIDSRPILADDDIQSNVIFQAKTQDNVIFQSKLAKGWSWLKKLIVSHNY